MLRLPSQSSPLRQYFDLADLADLATPATLATFPDALRGCRRTVQAPAVKSVQALCLRADGRVWLIQVGKRGVWRKLWDFGNPWQGCGQFA